MTKTIYTQKQMAELLRNPCVEKCSDKYITFKDDIKYEAVVLWKSWLSCKEVFEKYNFPEYIIRSVIPRKSIARWHKIINEKWKDYFWTKKKWRIKVEDDFDIKKMNKYEVEEYYKIKMKYYKESYDSIKKNLSKSYKFGIILKIYKKNKLYLSLLCNLAEVSISWFYAYKKRVENKQTKEIRDKDDYEIIKKMYLKHKRKFWYRMVTMKLYEAWTKMNHKKVYRIMKENNLFAIIRKRNPYKNIAKKNHEHRTCDNKLNRDFKWLEVYKKMWTDISYLYYNWTKAYLSVLKDMISWEIISHKVSSTLWLDFVLNTIKDANKMANLKWSIIHSDQWSHYTNPNYIALLKNSWIIQSMSRKWNCLDNAPTESFFWHMKDEIELDKIKSFSALKSHIDNYIFFYNNNRPQWTRKKMTPVAYRNHLIISKN